MSPHYCLDVKHDYIPLALQTAGTFHTRALYMIMGIRWQDRVTNQDVLDRACSTNIESMLLKVQLRWTGHVIRMSDSRIPRQLLYSELMDCSRNQGRPKLRLKDTLKSKPKRSGTSSGELEASAADRSAWRSLTPLAAAAFEEDRRQHLAAARDRRQRLRALQSKQQTIVVTPVRACVLPALDYGVTCALIAEGTDCAFVGY